MMAGEDNHGWVDTTRYGSDYQEQYNKFTGQYRHRQIEPFSWNRTNQVGANGVGPWSIGKAPERSECSG